MLKIGFDAKRLFLNNTGLGNYSRTMARSLLDNFPGHRYYLYSPDLGKKYDNLFPESHNLVIRQPRSTRLSSLWRTWRIVKDLKKDRLDIYHGLSNELPMGLRKTRIKSLVTIHDLIFLRFPELYNAFDRKIYKAKSGYACQTADIVIATSEQTKADIEAYFGVPSSKIEVVYQSCAKEFSDDYSEEELLAVKKKYNLPDQFLLMVGTIEERKNALLAIKALHHLGEETHLIVVGRKTPYAQQLEEYLQAKDLTHRVTFYENIPFSDLPLFYRLAQIFLFPSRFEGFGIPILEAITSGVPVIAAKGSCLEEPGGKGSIYIDPDDERAFAEAINYVLSDKNVAERMKREGLQHAQLFSAETIARRMMGIYKKLI